MLDNLIMMYPYSYSLILIAAHPPSLIPVQFLSFIFDYNKPIISVIISNAFLLTEYSPKPITDYDAASSTPFGKCLQF